VNRLLKLWERLLVGKDPFEGYTIDASKYEPITEADYESVTAISSPNVTVVRRRWETHKPDRKVKGYHNGRR
jgi:hypothetical protein